MSQNECCRTCLAEYGDLVSIFSDDCYVDNLPEKLYNTIRIEVHRDDELPKMICKKCIFLVDSLNCFKDQCEMAEIKLKESLTNSLPTFNVGELIKACETNAFNSDSTSEEEEYEVEYASEEARREYENTRKQERDKRKKEKPKVKCVEILTSGENIYKNLAASSSQKYRNTVNKEETNPYDSDKSSLSHLSDEESSRYSSNTYDKYHSDSVMSVRRSTYDGQKVRKQFVKRNFECDDSFGPASKVPKKVKFKDQNYDDQDLHYKEIIRNKVVPSAERYNMSTENHDIETGSVEMMKTNCVEKHGSKIVMNSLPSIPPNEDFQTTLDNRMSTLTRYATLNLPDICTICSGSFESPKEVLKHKLECHLKPDQSSYFCPICHENFPSNGNLVDHVNIHKGVQSLICVLCSGCFYTEETLRKHLQESHVNIHELKCNMCSKQFHQMQALLTHLKVHLTSVHFTCMLCSSVWSNKEYLQSHITKEHNKHLMHKNSKCETCGIRLTRRELIEHVKIHPSHSCPYCQRSFAEKEFLGEHITMHHKVIDEEEHQEYEDEDHQKEKQEDAFKCFVCQASFARNEERTQHMEDVHMHQSQQYTEKVNLNITQPQLPKAVKGDHKKFRCRVCHEILVSRYSYAIHLKEKHLLTKQTNEILKELSESSNNERRFDQIKSDDSLGST